MVKFSPNDPCMCHSGRKYKKCCRPFHDSKRYPSTPLELVRARFSAYALANIDFIMETTHPDGDSFNPKPDRWRAELEAYCFRTFFAELEILSTEENKVSYRAKILHFGMEEQQYIEHATFEQVNGRWLYVGGEMEDIELDTEADENTEEA